MGCSQSSISREALLKKKSETEQRAENFNNFSCSLTDNVFYQPKIKILPKSSIRFIEKNNKNEGEQNDNKKTQEQKNLPTTLIQYTDVLTRRKEFKLGTSRIFKIENLRKSSTESKASKLLIDYINLSKENKKIKNLIKSEKQDNGHIYNEQPLVNFKSFYQRQNWKKRGSAIFNPSHTEKKKKEQLSTKEYQNKRKKFRINYDKKKIENLEGKLLNFLKKKNKKKSIEKKNLKLSLRGVNAELGTYRQVRESLSKFSLHDFKPRTSHSSRLNVKKKFSISSLFTKKNPTSKRKLKISLIKEGGKTHRRVESLQDRDLSKIKNLLNFEEKKNVKRIEKKRSTSFGNLKALGLDFTFECSKKKLISSKKNQILTKDIKRDSIFTVKNFLQ